MRSKKGTETVVPVRKEQATIPYYPQEMISSPITDLDGIMKEVVNQMPMHDGEILYKSEIDGQIKLYIFQVVLGLIMILVSVIVWYKVT